MRTKKHLVEQTLAKLRDLEKRTGLEMTVPRAAKKLGITVQRSYRWQTCSGSFQRRTSPSVSGLRGMKTAASTHHRRAGARHLDGEDLKAGKFRASFEADSPPGAGQSRRFRNLNGTHAFADPSSCRGGQSPRSQVVQHDRSRQQNCKRCRVPSDGLHRRALSRPEHHHPRSDSRRPAVRIVDRSADIACDPKCAPVRTLFHFFLNGMYESKMSTKPRVCSQSR